MLFRQWEIKVFRDNEAIEHLNFMANSVEISAHYSNDGFKIPEINCLQLSSLHLKIVWIAYINSYIKCSNTSKIFQNQTGYKSKSCLWRYYWRKPRMCLPYPNTSKSSQRLHLTVAIFHQIRATWCIIDKVLMVPNVL